MFLIYRTLSALHQRCQLPPQHGTHGRSRNSGRIPRSRRGREHFGDGILNRCDFLPPPYEAGPLKFVECIGLLKVFTDHSGPLPCASINPGRDIDVGKVLPEPPFRAAGNYGNGAAECGFVVAKAVHHHVPARTQSEYGILIDAG
jgi:hypothetical protein